jgi:hypothetical protein
MGIVNYMFSQGVRGSLAGSLWLRLWLWCRCWRVTMR